MDKQNAKKLNPTKVLPRKSCLYKLTSLIPPQRKGRTFVNTALTTFCRWQTCQTFNFLISRSTRWMVHPKRWSPSNILFQISCLPEEGLDQLTVVDLNLNENQVVKKICVLFFLLQVVSCCKVLVQVINFPIMIVGQSTLRSVKWLKKGRDPWQFSS